MEEEVKEEKRRRQRRMRKRRKEDEEVIYKVHSGKKNFTVRTTVLISVRTSIYDYKKIWSIALEF